MRRFKFTADRRLSRAEASSLESMGPEIIEKYNALIESVRPSGISDIQWWSSYLASRVTVEGSPLDYMGLFFLLERNIKQYDEVVVEYPWQKKCVLQACQKHNHFLTIHCRKLKKIQLFGSIKKIAFCSVIFGFNYVMCLPLRYRKKRYKIKVAGIKLYAIDSSYKSGRFEDRYFPGLVNYIKTHTQDKVAYFPTLSSASLLSSWKTMFKMVTDKEFLFFFSEEFLSLKSVFKIFKCFLRGRRQTLSEAYVDGYDFSGLLNDYWTSQVFSHHRFLAIVNYFSIEGMKKKGINFSKWIVWVEGQPLDKLMMLALNKHYPGVEKIGYQGFIESPYFLSTYPTFDEKKNRVLPDVLAVCSSYLVENAKKFSAQVPVICAPGFRLTYSLDKKKTTKFRILFLLSNNRDEILQYLALFDRIISHPFGFDIEWCVRSHPARPIKLKKYQIFSSNEDCLAENLSKSDIVVAGCGSAGVEAVLSGCYTVVLQSKIYFTRSSLASVDYFSGRYQIIYDHDDLIKLIFECKKTIFGVGSVIDDFIVPVKKENIARFYNSVEERKCY
jgi:hypothetical protein